MSIEAKELYLQFAGSKYEMQRVGVLQQYLDFHVPSSQEEVWAAERVEQLLSQRERLLVTSTQYHELQNLIRNTKDAQILSKWLDWLTSEFANLDSFTLVRFAEDLFRFLDSDWLSSGEIRSQLKEGIGQLLQRYAKKEFTVSNFYIENPRLNGLLTKEKIDRRKERVWNELSER